MARSRPTAKQAVDSDALHEVRALYRALLDRVGIYDPSITTPAAVIEDSASADDLGALFVRQLHQKSHSAYYTPPRIAQHLARNTLEELVARHCDGSRAGARTPPERAEPRSPSPRGKGKSKSQHRRALLFRFLQARRSINLPFFPFPLGEGERGSARSGGVRAPARLLHRPMSRSEAHHGSHSCPTDELTLAACEHLLTEVLPALRIVDPACGAGDLLVAMFHALLEIHRRISDHAIALGSRLKPPEPLDVAQQIVSNNLFGVDLMSDAIEVARLRLSLAVAELLPRGSTLPDLQFQLRAGNALVGMLEPAIDPDAALLTQFRELGISYERLSWDETKHREGPVRKRELTPDDLVELNPVHWGEVFGPEKFDAVIANPPWDIFKPNAREFFERHSELVTKRRMSMEDFDTTRAVLLEDEEIREAWLEYVSSYRHLSAWFRSAPQFRHQVSRVNGRRAGTDTNLYKLFTEQSFNLVRPGGVAGLILPSGIYTDLGAKQLRELLFDQTTITGLIGFENRRLLFEDVHRSFKFVVLSFQKEARTESFPAVFMRHSLDELDRFPADAVTVRTELVRKLAPDSLSLMEFRTSRDVQIAEKLIRHPLLGDRLRLSSEFHMTADRKLFRTSPGEGRVPLFEGKMIWQFSSDYAPPRYWVDEAGGRRALASKGTQEGRRLAIRAIAANTNERTLIATLLPERVFCGNSLLVAPAPGEEAFYYVALLNSFVMDAFLRSKVTTNVNIFYLQQLPIPLFDPEAPWCRRLMQLSSQLLARSGDEASLRAELDGLVARVYGLDADDFEHLLTAFPLVPETVRNAAFCAFTKS